MRPNRTSWKDETKPIMLYDEFMVDLWQPHGEKADFSYRFYCKLQICDITAMNSDSLPTTCKLERVF